MNEVRNQAMRGDPAQYGVLRQYLPVLEEEVVVLLASSNPSTPHGIVRNAVRSALLEQRDAFEDDD